MKFYITKYALTKGIIKAESIVCSGDTISFQNRYSFENIKKPFWHVRKEDAIEHAEKMKKSKLKSLEKQIERVENANFKFYENVQDKKIKLLEKQIEKLKGLKFND